MVPPDLAILDNELYGLPDLKDTEMAMIIAPRPDAATLRLRDYITRELEYVA